MWYFAWVLGLGFAVLLAILNAIWLEYSPDRLEAFRPKPKPSDPTHPDNLTK